MKYAFTDADALGQRNDADTAFPPLRGSIYDTAEEWAARCALFPDVPLEDRLLRWAPGPGLALSLTTSSGKVIASAKHLHLAVAKTLGGGLEFNTRKSYGSLIGVFLDFCFSSGLGADDIFPISEGLLLAFVCSCTGEKRAKSVRNNLSALKTWHLTWGQRWTKYDVVSHALRGVAKLAPDARPLRPPVLPLDLVAARAFLQPTTDPLHAAVWACALFSFFACCRLSETTSPPSRFFDPARHATRAHVGSFRLVQGVPAVDVFLPWTKTTATAGLRKVVSEGRGLLEPIGALRWHLKTNALPNTDPAQTPLFAYKVRSGRGWRLTPLTKTTFLSTFCAALAASGRPTFTGHSFRIGGATFYWHRGATEPEIKSLGGWASDAYRVYLRDEVAGLAPLQQRLLP